MDGLQKPLRKLTLAGRCAASKSQSGPPFSLVLGTPQKRHTHVKNSKGTNPAPTSGWDSSLPFIYPGFDCCRGSMFLRGCGGSQGRLSRKCRQIGKMCPLEGTVTTRHSAEERFDHGTYETNLHAFSKLSCRFQRPLWNGSLRLDCLEGQRLSSEVRTPKLSVGTN